MTAAPFVVGLMPRTAEAVLAATTAVVGGGWGNYRQFHSMFSFYAAHSGCRTFVARDASGDVAGTAVATCYGRAGWIGHVFVRPDLRRAGLGTRLTTVAVGNLRTAGCESILLAATELGRPLYESLGFRTESCYHELRGPALPKTVELNPFRPLLPSDHRALATLDGTISGDDRAGILSRFRDYAWGISRHGLLVGAAIPVPWGGAAASLLPDAGPEATTSLIKVIRTVGSMGDEVIVYPPDENRRALDLLREEGFAELRTVPRMVLGKSSNWLPTAVWNPLSLGLG